MAASVKIRLSEPVQFGSELVEELELTPSSRAFRDCELPMKDDGTITFRPYELARIGVRLAGKPEPLLDKLAPKDMMEVATTVMGFLS